MKTLDMMTDEELVVLYAEGNNAAFDQLLDRYKSSIHSYIFFIVRNKELTEDIFQETFVKVITKLQEGKYIDSGKFSAWIMRIAHNVIMDWYRDNRAKNIVETSDDNDLSNVTGNGITDFNIEDRYVNEQVLRDVKKMMNLLPPTQREIVFMRFYQEMSFKEIAETTGVSINTALGRMRYAILNMRRMARKNKLSLETVY